MVIDFVSREELDLTTLKEFFEIFISSVKKEMQFHSELISPSYKRIGLSLKFEKKKSLAKLRLLLATGDME